MLSLSIVACSKAKPLLASTRARSSRLDSLAKPLAAQVQSKVIVMPTHQDSSGLVPLACLADNVRHKLIGDLAEEYSLDHLQPKRSCQQNADVARRHGLDGVAQLWIMLQLVLLDSLEKTASQSSDPQTTLQPEEDQDDDQQTEAVEDLVLEDVKGEPFENRQLDEASSGEDEGDEASDKEGARNFLANTDYEMAFSLGKNQQRIINHLPAVSAEVKALRDIKLLVDAIQFYADNDDIQLYCALLLCQYLFKDDMATIGQSCCLLYFKPISQKMTSP
eukprot:m.107513 g.107513  ORF g.107513 m.107513 type:complete len:277 (-) comp15316_c0_seq4:403-1233(-)